MIKVRETRQDNAIYRDRFFKRLKLVKKILLMTVGLKNVKNCTYLFTSNWLDFNQKIKPNIIYNNLF